MTFTNNFQGATAGQLLTSYSESGVNWTAVGDATSGSSGGLLLTAGKQVRGNAAANHDVSNVPTPSGTHITTFTVVAKGGGPTSQNIGATTHDGGLGQNFYQYRVNYDATYGYSFQAVRTSGGSGALLGTTAISGVTAGQTLTVAVTETPGSGTLRIQATVTAGGSTVATFDQTDSSPLAVANTFFGIRSDAVVTDSTGVQLASIADNVATISTTSAYLDKFSGAAGVLLENHTSDSGDTYVPLSGSAGSLALDGSGRLMGSGANGIYASTAASPGLNVPASMDLSILSDVSAAMGIIIDGVAGQDSGYNLRYYSDGNTVKRVQFYRFVSGSPTLLGECGAGASQNTTPLNYTTGHVYTLTATKVVAGQFAITQSIDGAAATTLFTTSVDPNPLPAGVIGYRCGGTMTASTGFRLANVRLPQPAAPALPTIADPSFETVSAGSATNKFLVNPTGSTWAFANGAGIAANGSAFGQPSAPDGAQVGFVKAAGTTITQAVASWAAGSYQITFQAAQRSSPLSNLDFLVLIDGTPVAKFQPTSTAFGLLVTPAFTVAAGSHTIQFQALNTAGGDNTTFLDQVAVVAGGSATATPGSNPPAAPTTATTYTLTGPASGTVGQASTAFTYTPNANYTGTITPTMTSLAGAWTPASLTWSGDASAKTAMFTPSTTGSGQPSGTSNPSLTAPTSITFQAAAPPVTSTGPATITTTAGGFPGGIAASISYTIYQNGTVAQSRSVSVGTAKDLGGGNYEATFNGAYDTTYVAVWDNGPGQFGSPDVVRLASASGGGSGSGLTAPQVWSDTSGQTVLTDLSELLGIFNPTRLAIIDALGVLPTDADIAQVKTDIAGQVWQSTQRTITAFGYTVTLAAGQIPAPVSLPLAADGSVKATLVPAGLDGVMVEPNVNARQALSAVHANSVGVITGPGAETGTGAFTITVGITQASPQGTVRATGEMANNARIAVAMSYPA